MTADRSDMQRLVDALVAGDPEGRVAARGLDESAVRVCLAVVLASVLELRLGTMPTPGAISAAARSVWKADGEREQLLIIEATMRAALGSTTAIRGLNPTALADAAATIIATELNAADSAAQGSVDLAQLDAVARRHLAEHLRNSDG